MRRFITASIISICFVVCCAPVVFASVLRQRAEASAPQPATQAISAADVFEVRISPARGFLVRRKGTVEWIDSSKLREPVVVGLLDGTSKIYAPSKVIKPPKAKHTEPPNYPQVEAVAQRAFKQRMLIAAELMSTIESASPAQ